MYVNIFIYVCVRVYLAFLDINIYIIVIDLHV